MGNQSPNILFSATVLHVFWSQGNPGHFRDLLKCRPSFVLEPICEIVVDTYEFGKPMVMGGAWRWSIPTLRERHEIHIVQITLIFQKLHGDMNLYVYI